MLRDILREVLEGVTCVSLREDKPSVRTFLRTVGVSGPLIFAQINPDVLFTYLPQLKTYRETNTKADSTERLHLDILIEFLTKHYASTSERLAALVKHKEITFELLPIFFRPNEVVYMIAADSEKPRCLMLDSGQMKIYDGKKYFELSCRYLTHDGKCFGEAAATTKISEFLGVMKITSLGVYPLEYHAERKRIVEELTKRGRKFMSLIETHHREYKGQAFYREKRDVRKFLLSGRVMVDATSFRDENPNYFFPRVDEKLSKDVFLNDDDSISEDSSPRNDREVTKPRMSCPVEQLLLCSESVYGFCLVTNQWGQYLSSPSTQYMGSLIIALFS